MARAAAAAAVAAAGLAGPNPSLKLAWPALSNLWSPCHQLTQPLQPPTARVAAVPVAAAGVGEVVEVIAGKAVTTSSISEAVAMPQPLVRRQPRRPQARQQWVTITTEAGEPRLVKVTSAVMEVTRVTDGTSKVTAIIGNRPPDNLILKQRGQTATEVKAPQKVPNIMTNLK